MLHTFTTGLLWTLPVLLAISALGGYSLSRRALRPVDQITAATRSISVSNLSARLPVPQSRDELQRLSETSNEMLARLESAVNEIKRFTADASHELRNPVSFIRTTAELALRNRQADSTSRRAFEEIVAECGKAHGLLKDMLTLARADTGHARLAFEPVDLVELLRASSQKAKLMAGERGHTLTIDVNAGSYATVLGDYASLHRLLWILLDNAAKYTPAPGTIRMKLAAATNQALVTVEDNGIGIPAADLPKIFDRFYRVDTSRSQVEGAGLGLSIAMWIATVHGATISAESRGGTGLQLSGSPFPCSPKKRSLRKHSDARHETAATAFVSVEPLAQCPLSFLMCLVGWAICRPSTELPVSQPPERLPFGLVRRCEQIWTTKSGRLTNRRRKTTPGLLSSISHLKY